MIHKSLFLALSLTALSAPAALAQLSITTPPALPVAVAGQAYSAQLAASGGAAPYTWTFQASGNPSARFSLSQAGLLGGTPVSADIGVLTFTIQVADNAGATSSRQFSVPVQATQPLTVTSTAFPAGSVGVPYSFQLTATGGTLPYKWDVLPGIVTLPTPGQISPGLLLNSATGLVSGTPAGGGDFTFTIVLTDKANTSVSVVFNLLISQAGPLGISTTTLPNGTLGAAYSQALRPTGGNPPYKWSVAAGPLPSGLFLDPLTGLLSGAPLASGTAGFTVGLTDSAPNPAMARQALTLTVVAPPALTITTYSPLPSGFQGAPYSQTLAGTGGVPPYLWTVAPGSLPAGLRLDAATGTLSGTPSSPISATFSVQVTDSAAGKANTASKQFAVNIAPLTPITISSGTLTRGTVQTPYSATLTASGGATPYAWKVAAGQLPPGLLLSTSGTISGVPTVSADFGFTVQVKDASGASVAAPIQLGVAAAPLQVGLLGFPSGLAGAPYPAQVLTASGGAPPYVFSITGSLPNGLSLSNGAISGTPATPGTSSFTVQVADSAKATATSAQQIVIRSGLPTDLALSTASLAFALSTGATDLPEPQNFTVASSSVGTILKYQVTVSPAAPWLSVAGGLNGSADTPGGIGVSLNAQALALAAAATPYSTTITIFCISPSPCAGNTQKVAVSLNVNSPPALLSLTRTLLALTATPTPGTLTASGLFGVQNAGGGVITVNSVNSSGDFAVQLTGVNTTINPGPPTYWLATVNPTNLKPGLYRSTVTIDTSAGAATLPVTLLVTGSLTMALEPVGQQFQMSAMGAVGNPNGSVQVLVVGGASATWSATVLPASSWLTLKSATGSSTPAAPGTLLYAIDPAAAATLNAGTYYGRIRVTSGQATNSPFEFLVVLTVSAGGTQADPDPQPAGLLFVANGAATIPSQSLMLYSGSVASTPYQAAAITPSGASWLTVTPTAGAASVSAPGHPTISVNAAGLAPGVYRGVVTYQFSAASLRSVNVTYIIPNATGGVLPFIREGSATLPRATCAATRVVATSVGLTSNFAQPVAWPVPMALLVTDDCGTAMGNANVDATFSTGDSPVSLRPDLTSVGRYTGTWIPRGTVSQVTISANASVPGLLPARVQITGKVTPNPAPALTPGATLNVFNPQVGAGVAPGTAVQIYGANFAPPDTSAIAGAVPFPTTLANTSVLIGGVPAPLYFVSAGQINALAPYELKPGTPYQILVNANGAISTPDSFTVTPGAPGIAAFPNGTIIAQHLDATLVLPASPARPGEIIVFYLAGLGTGTNQPPTGNPAPPPPTDPTNAVTVTLNGATVPTLFVGLTPGSVGLYQINLKVPDTVPDGNLILNVTQAGSAGNVTILPVKR
jgi:uncharacterized protein (TIGR03437 family)